MPRIIAHLQIDNFDQWINVFKKHASARKQAGFTKSRVFQDDANAHKVTVQLDCDDLVCARKFMESENLHQEMKKSGVLMKPEIHYLNNGETMED